VVYDDESVNPPEKKIKKYQTFEVLENAAF